MVLVADADVLFAGDLCFFGVTPLAFQGDPATWADVLDAVAELADMIVPGHGPVGGEAEVRELQAYLRHCVRGRRSRRGPWDDWLEREHATRSTSSAPRCSREGRRRDPAGDGRRARSGLTALTRSATSDVR